MDLSYDEINWPLGIHKSDRFQVSTGPLYAERRGRKSKDHNPISRYRTHVWYHPTGWHQGYGSNVEYYASEEDAKAGHEKWIKFMEDNPNIDPYEFKEWAYSGWPKPSNHSSGETPT